MESVDKLVEIIKALRAPDGCPWDREQTHKSIRGHLAEECAELLEAIDLDSPEKMCEELGDILMHVALHAEIAAEDGQFTLDDIARGLDEKLVRRHPHVFADKKAASTSDVLKIWEDVKAKEKKERVVGKMFDGIPPALSGLRYALDVAKKSDGALLAEVDADIDFASRENLEIGRELFETVRKAAAKKIEPEGALRDYIAEIRRVAERKGI